MEKEKIRMERNSQSFRFASQSQKIEMTQKIVRLTEEFEQNPEHLADFLTFGSRFFPYTLENNLLIYADNPKALYCQSFEAWTAPKDHSVNKRPCQIKKNEKGIKVYVSVKTTLLKVNGRLVPLEQADREVRMRYQAGELESVTKVRKDGIKVVFDISQTNYPVAEYHSLFHLGVPENSYGEIAKGLHEYAQEMGLELGLGQEQKEGNARQVIRKLLYEIGSGAAQQSEKKTEPEFQFKAAAFQILAENHLGLQTDMAERKHLGESFAELKAADPEMSVRQVLEGVYKTARKHIPAISQVLEQYIEPLQIKQTEVRRPHKERTPALSAGEVYDEMKRQIRITDYAREHGFTLVRTGRYYSLKEHDSVRIDTEKNCYWRNSVPGKYGVGKGDSVIGFAAEFVHHGDLHEALEELSGKISRQDTVRAERPPAPERAGNVGERKELVLPEKGKNMKRVYAYLIQTRYLDQDVVQDFVNRKMLYQDVKGNCVFVSHDQNQKPDFACIRGTLSDVRFLGDVEGCSYGQGFYIDNGADQLIITESVIDAMSVMSILQGQGKDYHAFDYLPMGGTGKYEAVLNHLKEQPKEHIMLALDHDLAGTESMQYIRELLIQEIKMDPGQITFHVPEKKDWNQELAEAAKHFRPLQEIEFLKDTDLSEIHACAIESTEAIQERGFRIREGKHQYRLVELDGDGNMIPVTITDRNTMFFSPKEVQDRIPNMYKEISYQELQKMQQEKMVYKTQEAEAVKMQQQEDAQKLPDSKGKEFLTAQEGIVIKEFFTESEYCMAKVIFQGVETTEGIWRRGEELYITTGWAVEGNLEEHRLSEGQREQLASFMKAHQWEMTEESPLLKVAMKQDGGAVERTNTGNSYLDQLHTRERNRNSQMEMKTGMELVM